ncbi:IS1595 family transposase [Streptococcus agalactiae]|uniref:IS1595 family transposase n=1 Tax=Streptococcus agalactiae TaxID=1311 RepID=UPI000E708CB1|nr:IS1595 family transposase [Streptococcus agalactiae]RJX45791.1 IS1595 family transposase [Streptococcus agalactiae]
MKFEFKSLFDLQSAFPTEQACIEHLEELRWGDVVVSPFDATSKVYKCKGNKYRCVNTKKYFNVKTDTLFENTKTPLRKWFMAIWMVTSHKKGISSVQLAKDIDVTQKTAWFMLERIRKCFGSENNNDLDDVVEVDETYIGGKNKNRHLSKKVKNAQGRSLKDKSAVVGMVQRQGKVNAHHVSDTKTQTLTDEIIKYVKRTAQLYTDEWLGYNKVADMYAHAYVNHGAREYVNGDAYTNTIEGFWAGLKRGVLGIYHSWSKKHLQDYVDEFVFRYNTRDYSDSQRFNLLLLNAGVRTTYKELINGY